MTLRAMSTESEKNSYSKPRLDQLLVVRGLVTTRSQALSWIKLGKVSVDGKTITKPGYFVSDDSDIKLDSEERYVSRAGLKLASVSEKMGLQFEDKVVLDVGSSTGGFTDFSLQHGARLVYAVDVGTDQMHESLKGNSKIRLYEKTDIRDFFPDQKVDIVVMDVSFVSLTKILPHIADISTIDTKIVAMAKPQFEATMPGSLNSKGIIKNDTVRRKILSGLEGWMKSRFTIAKKADSAVSGAGGNKERFYLLTLKRNSAISPSRIT